MAASWRNWSGKYPTEGALRFVRSEEDLAAVIRQASAAGKTVRAAGSGHSHYPLVANDGVVVDCSALAGIVSVDAPQQRATIWAGTPIYLLGPALHQHGLALYNQGDIDRQTLAGATGTGTHGTGKTLRSLSAQVTGLRLMSASGEVVSSSASLEPNIWQAARLHLGAFGIITQLELQLRECYRLQEHGMQASLREILPQLDAWAEDNRHFEFFWYPQRDLAVVKRIRETEDPAEYPVAEEGQRLGWNYEVLANHRPHLHTEMEYSVPAAEGAACLLEIAELVQREFPKVAWPIEYRYVAADDVWLSTAYERDTVTISVHIGIEDDDEAYFRACEAIFLKYEGRPHWGKVHYLNGEQLKAAHPRWDDWWQVQRQVDPNGTFLNTVQQSWRDS